MPNVCIDCRYLAGRPSGIGELVTHLIRHAPALAPELDFLLLRHASNTDRLSEAPNVREVALSSPANGPGSMWLLPKLVDLSGVDLFHAPANILPAGLSMKTLTTVHDIMWLTNPDWCNSGPFSWIDRAFYSHGIKRAVNCSSRLATVSNATKDAIAAHLPSAAPKLRVTLSGVSSEFAPQPRDNPLLLKLGIKPAQPFVLVVGQNAPYKNHEGAMRGFANAFRNDQDMQLVLVQRRHAGSNRLEQLAQSLGVAGRTHLLPSVDQGELIQLYSSAAVLLHPSLCEGFGNPLAEAMACGCPVITSNRSAMPEATGKAARLIDPRGTAMMAEALRDIVFGPDIAKRMSKAGLQRASQLQWDRFARENVSIYRELLSES